ncbi:prolyl oligopeptidase family serine peptidase [Alkalimonas collagenimarina]|uniref:Prolyl oligopeptidase family serine peptidase n=1 Tax=Alkalimonas collagenimarina TaxID=400390 RepID=A0ABT9GZE8_9GAMM|nr:prolyl oligopeptidase family serine peptidase [Alkalimonas collagenimarina]MDP4536436.1 prolyl oligopeptidase family serine peptidase [Alkalimonas collagenimarina]
MKLFRPSFLAVALVGVSLCSFPIWAKKEAATYSIETVQLEQVYASDPSIRLTMEKIMSDPDWLGRQPESAFWSADNQHIYYQRKREGSEIRDWFVRAVDADTQDNGRLVPLAELHTIGAENAVYSADGAVMAYLFQGNLFARNLQTNELTQLTRSDDRQSHPQFLADGRLAYRSGWSYFAVDVNTGLTEQLLSIRTDDAPEAPSIPDSYMAREQHKLIDYVALQHRNQLERHEATEALKQQNPAMPPQSVYVGKNKHIVDASLAPNANYLLVAIREQQASSDKDIMPNYISPTGDIVTESVRRRVHDFKPLPQQLILVDLSDGSQHTLSYSSLPGYNEDVLKDVKAENARARGERYRSEKVIRDIGLMTDWYWTQSAMRWHPNGQQVAIMLKAFDNKDRWLATVDFDGKKLVPQHRLHDSAWVNYAFNDFGWLNQSETLYFLSEESGYAHLYSKSLRQRRPQQLTSGTFEVANPVLTSDDRFIYFKGNRNHPGQYDVFRLELANNQLQQVTSLPGSTDFVLSPNEQQLLLRYSNNLKPVELYATNATPGADVVQLTDTISEAFKALPLQAPKIVPVPSSHGDAPIFSKLYLPENHQDGEPKRAVIFNHGAGYLQNSDLGWSGYFREFLFHNLLTQHGYVVLDMDYRASKGYGRDWRTAIYRQMGTPEIEDLVDGVNWMVEHVNVDRERVGTYGGSYGGFMTFMALFKEPDLFQAGAALRPVSDWAYYNHPYTSNILNTPDIDPIAYERSSPIYFTQGLTKPLLINAPMVDDNVFFQDVVRLVQRLIEQEIVHFETAIYPVEPHGFRQPSSWLDEYRRIFKLFEDHL